MRTFFHLVTLLLSLLLTTGFILAGLTGNPTHAESSRPAAEISAADLLRRVVDHELAADKNDQSLWMFISKTGKDGRETTDRIVETREGSLYKHLMLNGEPLTPQQEKKEQDRIRNQVSQAHGHKIEKDERSKDGGRAQQMLALLPQATIPSYGERHGDLITIAFRPNPAFHPKSHEAEVFQAMTGTILVNSREDRLAEIDGQLMKEVKFGDGILGHLDKGGEFHVKQTEVQPGHWEVTRLLVNMKGKALFFKSINVQQDETHTDYHRLPDNSTLAQGAAMLDH